MNLFDVYPLFDVEIVRGKGCRVFDADGLNKRENIGVE